jgi:hypothetical protein
MTRTVVFVLALCLAATSVAHAAVTAAQQCEAAKIRAAARKDSCIAAVLARQALGSAGDTSRCDAAFSAAFAKAERQYGDACPTKGDKAKIERRIDAQQSGTAQLLAGEGRFHDNGDGTVTDAKSGLVWEKKSKDGGLHDVNAQYSWSVSGTANGTLFTSFLAGLNAGSGFAGHTDWRIPTISELETIVDYRVPDQPTVAAAFDSNCVDSCTVITCSCTEPNFYWSSTLVAVNPVSAWGANFNGGVVNFVLKLASTHARAVRGGS